MFIWSGCMSLEQAVCTLVWNWWCINDIDANPVGIIQNIFSDKERLDSLDEKAALDFC